MLQVAVAFARHISQPSPVGLCGVCADFLDVSGAGITLMSGLNSGPVCSSNDRSGAIEDLQFTLGQGPCQDAFATGEPVTETDLAGNRVNRWPQFTPQALEIGARGVFAYPLSAGPARIGVLTLYQDLAGALTEDQEADCRAVAEVIAQTILTSQAASRPGVLADELDNAGAHRAEVHQASGMVAVQLGVDVAEGALRLRAHSYVAGRSIADVAADIVARRLRLSGDDQDDGDGGVSR